MATFTQIVYHIVFCTKNRARTLELEKRKQILAYIWGVLKNHNSQVYQINLMEDHVHLLCSLHPSTNLSDLVKVLKSAIRNWMKANKISKDFYGWQPGYAAFTVSWRDKQTVIGYVRNQQEHHRRVDFITEYKSLLDEFGIAYEDAYLEH